MPSKWLPSFSSSLFNHRFTGWTQIFGLINLVNLWLFFERIRKIILLYQKADFSDYCLGVKGTLNKDVRQQEEEVLIDSIEKVAAEDSSENAVPINEV